MEFVLALRLSSFCSQVLRLHPSVPKKVIYVCNDDTFPDGTKLALPGRHDRLQPVDNGNGSGNGNGQNGKRR